MGAKRKHELIKQDIQRGKNGRKDKFKNTKHSTSKEDMTESVLDVELKERRQTRTSSMPRKNLRSEMERAETDEIIEEKKEDTNDETVMEVGNDTNESRQDGSGGNTMHDSECILVTTTLKKLQDARTSQKSVIDSDNSESDDEEKPKEDGSIGSDNDEHGKRDTVENGEGNLDLTENSNKDMEEENKSVSSNDDDDESSGLGSDEEDNESSSSRRQPIILKKKNKDETRVADNSESPGTPKTKSKMRSIIGSPESARVQQQCMVRKYATDRVFRGVKFINTRSMLKQIMGRVSDHFSIEKSERAAWELSFEKDVRYAINNKRNSVAQDIKKVLLSKLNM